MSLDAGRSGRPVSRLTSRSRWRLIVLQVLLLSLAVTLLGRLAYLQLSGGSRTAALVGQGAQIVSAPRGVIVDQTGQPLAANRTAVDVVVDRATFNRQPDSGAASLAKVAAAIGTDAETLKTRMIPCGQPGAAPGCFTGAATEPLPVAKDVPVGDVLDLIENPGRYPGVTVASRSVRDLPAVDGAQALIYSATWVRRPAGTTRIRHCQGQQGGADGWRPSDTELRGTTAADIVPAPTGTRPSSPSGRRSRATTSSPVSMPTCRQCWSGSWPRPCNERGTAASAATVVPPSSWM
jgi:hypothetical protein